MEQLANVQPLSGSTSDAGEAPRRAVPRGPVLSGESFGSRGATMPSVLQAGAAIHTPSGRIALGHALRESGVQAGDEVLTPAYHCKAMIGPIRWLAAHPVLYKVDSALNVDIDDIRTKITARSKVLLIVHYFGFPQNLVELQRFCQRYGLVLIEDCAHSFFGEFDGQPIGSFGQFAIASTMKFFPVYDGGCLVSSQRPLGHLALRSPGALSEMKATVNIVERALQYRRLGLFGHLLRLPLQAKTLIWRHLRRQVAAQSGTSLASNAAELADGDEEGFEPAWLGVSASRTTRILLNALSHRHVVERRRHNFKYLLRQLADLPGARPLHRALPEGVVPWVFPMLFDDVNAAYELIDRTGVPIPHFGKFLWPAADPRTCAVSADYSRRLLQFPCHQELTERELTWMAEQIRNALRQLTTRSPSRV